MAEHGIVTGYRRSADSRVDPVLAAPDNLPARAWGLPLYRQAPHAFCSALTTARSIPADDIRPATWQVMDAFWAHPTAAGASAWGSYPYDSHPAGTALRPLAHALTIEAGQCHRGDRAWIAGSLALSTEPARTTFLRHARRADLLGSPAID